MAETIKISKDISVVNFPDGGMAIQEMSGDEVEQGICLTKEEVDRLLFYLMSHETKEKKE